MEEDIEREARRRERLEAQRGCSIQITRSSIDDKARTQDRRTLTLRTVSNGQMRTPKVLTRLSGRRREEWRTTHITPQLRIRRDIHERAEEMERDSGMDGSGTKERSVNDFGSE